MRKSLRWRLQVWYGLVLLGVVTGFAGILFYRVRAARFQEIDARLTSNAQYLEASLRLLPPHVLDGPPPPPSPPPPPQPDERHASPPPPPPGLNDMLPGPPPKLPPPHSLAYIALPDATNTDARLRSLYFGIWLDDGTLLKAKGLPPETSALVFDRPNYEPSLRQHGEFREVMLPGPEQTSILVGQSVQADRDELARFGWQLVGLGTLLLSIGLAGGWLVSGRILRPVGVISTTASAISATSLSERLDVSVVDRELVELASVLNAMFARLEAAFERQARFTADASHELRTPLAIIRSHAELALARPRTADEYRDAIDTCLRASSRMTALVDGLLMLARADAGKLDLRQEPIDLRSLVEEGVTLFRPLASSKQVALDACLAETRIVGDPLRLEQVLTNLLSNALYYNHPGGRIEVQLGTAAAEVVLTVRDTGCGIPAEDQAHIFERFYRVDKARARASGGNGLGLAICKSIVEAHGGTLGFDSTPGAGSTFWVCLPAAGVGDGVCSTQKVRRLV